MISTKQDHPRCLRRTYPQCGVKENLINKRGSSITSDRYRIFSVDSSQFIHSQNSSNFSSCPGPMHKSIDHPTQNRFVILFICRENESSNGDYPSSKRRFKCQMTKRGSAAPFGSHAFETSPSNQGYQSLQRQGWLMHIYARLPDSS